ncbi:MAG: hypothetical protein R3217_03775 [Gammaproteobacteria bacterium]|nr:hypothetical protein [Gammaproteobacteria bacterium]
MVDFFRELVQESAVHDFWLIWLAGVAVALRGIYLAREYWQTSRLVEDLPPSRTRSAAQGYVQLVGVIQDDGNLVTSPLNGDKVAWWSFTEQELLQGSGRNMPVGVMIAYLAAMFFFPRARIFSSKQSNSPFVVKDDTGMCAVYPEDARVIAADKRTGEGWSSPEIKPEDRVLQGEKAQVTRRRGSRRSWDDGRKRIVEYRLSPGERIYAIGRFESFNYQVEVNELHAESIDVLAEMQQDKASILERFDSNQDGKLDAAEWARLRRAANVEASMRLRGRVRRETRHRIRKPDADNRFVIISLDDPALGPALRRRAMLWLLAFFSLGTACLLAFNLRVALSPLLGS